MLKRIIGPIAAIATMMTATACDRRTESLAGERPEPSPTDWFAVNAATYSYDDAAPAHEAFTRVARWRGWTDEEIEAWRPFIVDDIIRKESHYCYNVRALNPRFANGGVGCVITRNGRQQDAGFGQVVLRFNPWLCEAEGYCDPSDITMTAWDSMNAVLALVEHSGIGPWNYDNYSRRFHPTLRRAPIVLPNADGVTVVTVGAPLDPVVAEAIAASVVAATSP